MTGSSPEERRGRESHNTGSPDVTEKIQWTTLVTTHISFPYKWPGYTATVGAYVHTLYVMSLDICEI